MKRKSNRAGEFRILLVRPDRIGDVILSTPVFQAIKDYYPNVKVTVLVQPFVKPVLEGLTCVDEVLTYEPKGRHKGIKGFFALIREIRQHKFHSALVLHSHRRIAAAIYGAGVKYRVGPFSKIHSYLFFNKGLRQHRSHVEMHEADYNLQLLRRFGIRVETRKLEPKISVSDASRHEAEKWLKSAGWNPSKKLLGVHPGMGGSALNWSEKNYTDLVASLIKEGHQVLVTAGPTETAVVNRMKAALGETAEKVFFFEADYNSPLNKLAAVIEKVDVMIAPSTGPMHMAVALGRPVVTFFPPIRVQSAIRWGPYLKDEERASILVPEAHCGEDFKCRGSVCHYYPCMSRIPVSRALSEVKDQLARGEKNET